MGRVISVSTAAFDGHGLPCALETLARLGVTHVEPAYIQGYMDFTEDDFDDAHAAALGKRMGGLGIGCVAVSAHIDAGAEEAVAQLSRRLRFAAAIGASFVITNTTTRDRRAAFHRHVTAVLPLAESLGVALAFENPGHGSDTLIGRASDAAAVLGRFGSPWVTLNYDAGNVFTFSAEQVAPQRDVGEALPWARHMHLKDVEASEYGWRFTAIGAGSIDYPALLSRLSATSVPLALELPLRLERPGRGPMVRRPEPVPLPVVEAAITRSLEFVRRQLTA